MLLSADRESSKVFAAVQNDGKTERYDCIISVCPNPACMCKVVSLDLFPEQTQGQDVNPPHPWRVEIDFVKRRLSFKEEEKVSKVALVFARLFLSKLDEGDFNFLRGRYLSLKNEFSENADSGSIDAKFEYHKIETDGLLVAYNDILPYGDQMFVTINGNQYAVLDQFCLLPHCSCAETILSIMTIDAAGKAAEEVSAIALDYRKRQWGKVIAYSISFSADTIRSAVETQIPGIYKKLPVRHIRLKTIYACCKKKHYQPRQPLAMPKVGRNDPCPCGSEKKHKKCCLGKN